MRLSIHLPPAGSHARECIDVDATVPMLAPDRRRALPFKRDAIRDARAFLADHRAAKSLQVICWSAAGHIQLVRVGCRGGVKVLWTFTRIRP
jgi:hypothetical protein